MAFEEIPFEEMDIEEFGIEELESRLEMAAASPTRDVTFIFTVEVSW